MVMGRNSIFLMLLVEVYMLPGPFNTVEVRVVSFNASSTDIVDFTKLRIVGRDHRINGTVHLKKDIDNESYTVSAQCYNDINGNGEYKLLPFFISEQHACDAMNTYWPYSNGTFEYGVNTNFPGQFKPCPIPKGIYYYKDIIPNTDKIMPAVPRGFSKMENWRTPMNLLFKLRIVSTKG